MSKQINTRIQNKYDLEVNWNKIQDEFIPLEGEIIIYGVEVDENDNILVDSDGNPLLPTDRTDPYTYPRMKVGDGATLLGELAFIKTNTAPKVTYCPQLDPIYKYEYLGEFQGPDILWMTQEGVEIDSQSVILSGDVSAIDVGRYTIVCIPQLGYCWEDGSINPKYIHWQINKGLRHLSFYPEIENNNNTIVLDPQEPINRAYFTFHGDLSYGNDISRGIASVVSDSDSVTDAYIDVVNPANCIVIEPSFIRPITIDSEGNIQDVISTITLTIEEDNNYEKESITLYIDASKMFYEDLNLNTWDQISQAASLGVAQQLWSVGDIKQIILGDGATETTPVKIGSAFTMTAPIHLGVYIIGFNHDNTENTIDFGTFKYKDTTTNQWIDCCLVDKYAGSGGSTVKNSFIMSTTKAVWKDCDMRHTVLGSSKDKQDDAPQDTATTPGSDTLMSALPYTLRNNMKPMGKYSTTEFVTIFFQAFEQKFTEYLPLLSSVECVGYTNKNVNILEAINQDQYEYYRLSNTRIKYGIDEEGNVGEYRTWWLRSIYGNEMNNISYGCVGTEGGAGNMSSFDYYHYGVAPIFRV